MQGTIIAFSRELRTGYIFGEDGEEYVFTSHHWQSDQGPQTSLKVSFENAAGEAVNITLN